MEKIIAMALMAAMLFYLIQQNVTLKSEVNELETEKAALEEGAALAEKLRSDNAALAQERDSLLMELKNAEDFNTVLSPAFRDALDRMRKADGQRPVGNP